MLEEASNNTVEESQRLVKGFDELASRLGVFEAKSALTEASVTKKVNVMQNIPFCHLCPIW